MADQQIRFCRAADGTRLAYALVGAGPPLLYVNGWPEHLEAEWRQPHARDFLRRLARTVTLVRYDMRGSGLSDRDVAPVDLDTLADDLITVANQIGERRVAVLALGMLAGPLAVRLAAEHPERVERMILAGGFLDGRRLMDPERARGLVEYVRRFGFPHFDFVDGDGVSLEDQRAIRDVQRAGAPPERQAEVLEAMLAADVTGLAPAVRCPTLVLHATDDPIVPFEQGRALAAALPDATLRPLEADTSAVWSLSDALVPEIERFLGATPRPDATRGTDLTARELDVLERLAAGWTNREIGAALGITEKTVKTHVGNVLAKLSARDRSHAAALAVAHGLVPAGVLGPPLDEIGHPADAGPTPAP